MTASTSSMLPAMEKPMPPDHQQPLVAIVGRPNVGKSAIFNRMAGQRIAIVHDQPGVTRDRITAPALHTSIPYSLMDTGGIGAALDDGFTEQVRAEVEIGLEMADLILFVVDGREGSNAIDDELARTLRKTSKPVLLVVNQVDNPDNEDVLIDFSSLGFRETLAVSAAHGHGFSHLRTLLDEQLEPIAATFPTPGDDAKTPLKIAIVGRPNVGKSSLVNAILKDQRTLVSDVAGTTRDAVDVPYQHGKNHYLFIDTAGIRRRTRRDSSVEIFSVMRSESSIERADVCALVIDSAAGVSVQDRRIARMILEAGKPCIIILNKFDLYHPDGDRSERIALLQEEVGRELFFLHYAPFVALSALKGQQISRLFNGIEKIRSAARNEINTGTLNRLIQQAMARNPPPLRKGKRLKILYAALARTGERAQVPVPHYILFINHKNLVPDSYKRYLENKIREDYPYLGLPILFDWRARKKKTARKG
ncbi:MAG: ribosome biogenesis GTPase Der [Verrucomicrobiota bacterium]